MGVFGEKHTSLTREQKRQLIRQADTYKLRPTEVCDWVQATWGLRIARVTVYSILHKQRASLMAGHKDLYQSIHKDSNSGASTAASSSSKNPSFTNTYSSSQDACLEANKDSGRVNKYRTSGKRSRSSSANASSSVASDLSQPDNYTASEGTRWEGQLKRVREPASVELDRAMVQFLKSSAAVDAHGRRLNDAELQSHALRLARGIPSASRMRCSFGWLRHFKRRLGVQWAADRLGRYRWIIETDPFGPSTDTDSQPSSAAEVAPPSAEKSASAHNYTPRRNASSRRQGKREHGDKATQSESHSYLQQTSDEVVAGHEDDSCQELSGKDYELSPEAVHSLEQSKRNRSTSTSTSNTDLPNADSFSLDQLQQPRRSLDLHHHQHRHYSSLASFPSHTLDIPTSSLAHPSHSTFLSLHSHTTHSSILDSFPSLFDSLPPLQTAPATVPTSQLLPNNTTLNSSNTNAIHTSSSPSNTDVNMNPSQFGMMVDGGMRKVPSKDEAYEMLQSLLLYYEQDQHHGGGQQTLLLPRWIHQQRQIMQETDENDASLTWMRQNYPRANNINHQQTQTSPLSSSVPATFAPHPLSLASTSQHQPHPLSAQSLSYTHSNFSQTSPIHPSHRSASSSLSPPLSPASTSSPTPSTFTSSSLDTGVGGINSNGISNSATSNNN
ncbi:hypothetical protein BX616_001342, partial [Lobosporangium transversale]